MNINKISAIENDSSIYLIHQVPYFEFLKNKWKSLGNEKYPYEFVSKWVVENKKRNEIMYTFQTLAHLHEFPFYFITYKSRRDP